MPWGGQACLRYYLEKEKSLVAKRLHFAEKLMEEEDPNLPQEKGKGRLAEASDHFARRGVLKVG